jgi:hypothetical protein
LSLDCLKAWAQKYVELAAPNLNEDEPETPAEAMPEFEN